MAMRATAARSRSRSGRLRRCSEMRKRRRPLLSTRRTRRLRHGRQFALALRSQCEASVSTLRTYWRTGTPEYWSVPRVASGDRVLAATCCEATLSVPTIASTWNAGIRFLPSPFRSSAMAAPPRILPVLVGGSFGGLLSQCRSMARRTRSVPRW